MKKIIALALALVMLLSLAACGKSEGSGNAGSTPAEGQQNNGGNAAATQANGQQNENGNAALSGAVVGVKSDLYAPNVGSQAEKYWQVKEIQNVYEFDTDGKCTVRDTVYYLKDDADYDTVNAELEGGNWKPTWESDHKSFRIDQGFKDYTSVEDAIEDMEEDFRGYTIVYSNGGTKYVDPPTDEQKTEMMKEVFGFTFDDVQTTYGKYEYSYTRKKDKVMVTYIDNATVEDINALAKAAFAVCQPLAEEGKVYDYLGKYGSELSAAPEVDSIFNSAQFNYYRNGKEITVQAEILNSEGHDNTLALLVAIMK